MSRHQHFYRNEIRKYPFLFLLIPLVTGIYLQSAVWMRANYVSWLTLLIATFLFAVFIHRRRSLSGLVTGLRFASIFLVLVAAGASLSFFNDIRNRQDWYGHLLSSAGKFKVELTSSPEEKERTVYVPCAVTAAYSNGKWQRAQGKVKVYFYKNALPSGLRSGDGLVLDASRFLPIKNAGNPFGFDYAAYARRQGWYHQVFCASEDVLYFPGKPGKTSWLEQGRSKALHAIKVNVADSSTQSLIAAMMLNERSDLDENLWQAYATTGIIHIISISGMHVAMLFNLLLAFLLWIRNEKYRWVKYFIAVPLVWLYISLAAFPPSAVRAGTMFTLLALGIRLGRESNSINTLLATAFLLLVYDPYWLYDTGFQLSFTAVLSILLFYPSVRSWLRPASRIGQAAWDSLAVCLAAQILTFPLGIYYFHQFPLWVMLAALPAALFSILLMGGATLLLFLSLFTKCVWLGQVLSWITMVFHTIIRWLSAATPDYFHELYIDVPGYWLLTVALVFIAFAWLRHKKWMLLPVLIIVAIIGLDYAFRYREASHQQRFVVYNVSRHSLYDYFKGRSVIHYYGKDQYPPEKTFRYVLLPARLGWMSPGEKTQAFKGLNIWSIEGKRIVALDGAIQGQVADTCDYLVLTTNCAFEPELWRRIFFPKKIILDGSFPRWKAEKWKGMLQDYHVPLHVVQEDGAWVFPGD